MRGRLSQPGTYIRMGSSRSGNRFIHWRKKSNTIVYRMILATLVTEQVGSGLRDCIATSIL
jgi:hypothetical protein